MIKIKRADCPESLNKPSENIKEKDYKKEDVKKALLKMQHSKCCYCEKNLFGPGGLMIKEVDHFRPQSAQFFKDSNGKTQWHLANAWDNLLYSCRDCNIKKSNTLPFDEGTRDCLIVNPSDKDVDPEDHIDFILKEGLMAHNINGKTPLGASTNKIFEFNIRTDLIGSFSGISLEIQAKINELNLALINDNDSRFKRIKKELTRSMSADIEFGAFRRAYTKKMIKNSNEKILPELATRFNKKFENITIDFPHGSEIID